jgi:hypothetical protein
MPHQEIRIHWLRLYPAFCRRDRRFSLYMQTLEGTISIADDINILKLVFSRPVVLNLVFSTIYVTLHVKIELDKRIS